MTTTPKQARQEEPISFEQKLAVLTAHLEGHMKRCEEVRDRFDKDRQPKRWMFNHGLRDGYFHTVNEINSGDEEQKAGRKATNCAWTKKIFENCIVQNTAARDRRESDSVEWNYYEGIRQAYVESLRLLEVTMSD